jgi:hypothetical protein
MTPNEFVNFPITGKITRLEGDEIYIDQQFCCNRNEVCDPIISQELRVGCKIKYMAYKPSEEAHTKVVKIKEIMGSNWDREAGEISDTDSYDDPFPSSPNRGYAVEDRKIPALVCSTMNSSMRLKVDDRYITVDSSKFPGPSGKPWQEGDRIYITAKVQDDPSQFNRRGEIRSREI